MPLTPESPIIIEKTLTKFWAKSIHIQADLETQFAEAVIHLLPYNDAGESSDDALEKLVISDLLGKIQADPTGNIAQAYTALLAAIQEEYDLQAGA